MYNTVIAVRRAIRMWPRFTTRPSSHMCTQTQTRTHCVCVHSKHASSLRQIRRPSRRNSTNGLLHTNPHQKCLASVGSWLVASSAATTHTVRQRNYRLCDKYAHARTHARQTTSITAAAVGSMWLVPSQREIMELRGNAKDVRLCGCGCR